VGQVGRVGRVGRLGRVGPVGRVGRSFHIRFHRLIAFGAAVRMNRHVG
jgi:hypothetical protein